MNQLKLYQKNRKKLCIILLKGQNLLKFRKQKNNIKMNLYNILLKKIKLKNKNLK